MGAAWATCPSETGGLQKGQKHPQQYPGTGNNVDGMSKVWGITEGKTVSFQIDNTTAGAYLLKEAGTHCKTLNGLVRKILLKCHENGIMVCPEYLRGKSLGRCPIQGQESSGLDPRLPSMPQVIKMLGNPSSGPLCKQSGEQGTQIFQPVSLRQGSIQRRCLEGDIARGPQVCLPTSKHHPNGPGQVSKIWRGCDHDHTLLVRSELVSRDYASSSRATRKV